MRPPRDTRTQLFVGNLPYRVRWQDLKDLFRRAGTVLRADVSLAPDNRSRGYGTVLLATAEDAGRAIDMFNGFVWQTRTLEVRHDKMGVSAMGEEFHNPGAVVGAGIGQGLGGGLGIGGSSGTGSSGGSGTGTPYPPVQPGPLSRFSLANPSSPILFSAPPDSLASINTNLPSHLALAGQLASPSAKSPLLGAPSPLSAAQSPLLSQLTGSHTSSSLLTQQAGTSPSLGGERSRNLFVGNVRTTSPT
jgi:RNA recognition motif-containing protein